MLKIRDLYKEKKNLVIKNISLSICSGESVSIECGSEMGDLLTCLILGQELPAKGEITLEGNKNTDYIKKNIGKIGVVLREETLYERMTIEEYIRFFWELTGRKKDYKEIMLKLALLDIGNVKIKHLNYSQKRRVCFARERLKAPEFFIYQEPILNMDREGAGIIIENINELCQGGTFFLITSVYFKDTIMVGERSYRLDSDGLTELHNGMTEEGEAEAPSKPVSENKIYKVEKIPAKAEDKLLLFDPMEIDYVESEQSINYLYIRGEKFPCNLTLTDLEERLKCFGFFRCHRSYLVNLQRVREVITWTRNSYSLNLDDKMKSSIPLSKGRLEDLKIILKI